MRTTVPSARRPCYTGERPGGAGAAGSQGHVEAKEVTLTEERQGRRRLPGGRWRSAAIATVVLACFAIALARTWEDVMAAGWRVEAGTLALACISLALSYALAAGLWGAALARAGGPGAVRGARIWFLANLARYVPGNVWSFVGAVELARRDGVPRHATLALMALTQGLAVGTALLIGLPVLLVEHARLGSVAATGAGVALLVIAVGALAAKPLGALLRRRYPGVHLRDLVPSPAMAAGLALGYAVYWVVTGLAFAAFTRSLHPVAAADVPLLVAAYAAAYAAGFLALLSPAGLGVREATLVVALNPVLPPGPALVVAIGSRAWMMALELLGAGAAYLLDRRLGGPGGKAAALPPAGERGASR